MYQRWLAGWRRCGCARVRINRQSRGRTGFRDHAVYRGRQVYFYKRAQILVADLWAALGRPAAGVCARAAAAAVLVGGEGVRVPRLPHVTCVAARQAAGAPAPSPTLRS